jgi:hypothetical protein
LIRFARSWEPSVALLGRLLHAGHRLVTVSIAGLAVAGTLTVAVLFTGGDGGTHEQPSKPSPSRFIPVAVVPNHGEVRPADPLRHAGDLQADPAHVRECALLEAGVFPSDAPTGAELRTLYERRMERECAPPLGKPAGSR